MLIGLHFQLVMSICLVCLENRGAQVRRVHNQTHTPHATVAHAIVACVDRPNGVRDYDIRTRPAVSVSEFNTYR